MNTTEIKIIKALIICAFMYGIGFLFLNLQIDNRRIITKCINK